MASLKVGELGEMSSVIAAWTASNLLTPTDCAGSASKSIRNVQILDIPALCDPAKQAILLAKTFWGRIAGAEIGAHTLWGANARLRQSWPIKPLHALTQVVGTDVFSGHLVRSCLPAPVNFATY